MAKASATVVIEHKIKSEKCFIFAFKPILFFDEYIAKKSTDIPIESHAVLDPVQIIKEIMDVIEIHRIIFLINPFISIKNVNSDTKARRHKRANSDGLVVSP